MHTTSFSALQRAEIAEIITEEFIDLVDRNRFSALQRAEIAEMARSTASVRTIGSFSALQRAEIAEIVLHRQPL